MSDLMRDLHSIDRPFSVARQEQIKGETKIKVDPNKKQTQKLCFSETLPNALRILNTKDKEEFLVGFIFYITGSAYLPNLDMNPNFKFVIEFSPHLANGDLPTAATCANLLRLSAWAYDNNVEELCKRLETAVKVGKYAGYGMN